MPNSHTLDVAFNSAITPLHANKPIAMAYGFVLLPEGHKNRGEGQGARSVKGGTSFSFDIFDAANVALPSNQSIAAAAKFTTRNPANPVTPLKDQQGNPVTTNPVLLTLTWQSTNAGTAGCNILNAAWWNCGSGYTLIPSTTNKMYYGCTITVTVYNNDTNPPTVVRTYEIDPEMIIEEAIPPED